ncbi:MAG: hypothetical protein KGH64_01675 [Candidatus Micrarchaeota archaeon]|nr:hypothetical protein [Candidatus Micrarchaeota archaeon]MDE1834026.1 hypothetical protein [Candidatus Micrarchaeota archaeon]
MAGVANDSLEIYKDHIKLILIFSIPFIIAFIIPFLAPLPTYTSAGAIFLRSASIFANGNINLVSLAVITISTIFSLLFLSFAFVLISLIVKSKKTHTRIGRRAFLNIETYIGRVFTIFLAYTILLFIVNIFGYSIGLSAQLTGIVGFVSFALLFYAPSATVVDDKRLGRAVRDSVVLLFHEPQYFFFWLVLITVVVSIVDYVSIALFGTPLATYVVLVVNSLFVLPYFVIFQAVTYMLRFKLLRH